jgi:hypothetical protein
MLAYTTKKSYLGPLGFDSLNFFTNDDVKYTGFEPSKFEIAMIGKFVQRLNETFFSTEPTSLMISKVSGVFVADVKVFNGLKMISSGCEGSTLGFVLQELERRIYM